MKLFLILSTFIAAAYASCPSSCSGNGKCGEFDKCICFDRWIENDCSVRQCPYGLSWVAAKATDVVPAGGDLGGKHAYSVCSSRGLCGETGECECFEGYTGRACTRTTCPNSCSGKGRCIFNNEEAYGIKDYVSFNSQAWDAGKTRQCVCDRGYGGVDCSSRLCPTGDDPLTKCDSAGASDSDDTQVIQVISNTCTPKSPGTFDAECAAITGAALATTAACSGVLDVPITGTSQCDWTDDVACTEYFTLTFTDMFNGQYTTRPIGVGGTDWTSTYALREAAAVDMAKALKELPNFAVPDVTIAAAFAGSCVATAGVGVDVPTDVACAAYTGSDLETNVACDGHGSGSAQVCEWAASAAGAVDVFEITFVHPANAGQQDTLKYQAVGGPSQANQPRFAKTTCTAVVTRKPLADTEKHKENDPCSNRGSCDSESGLCSCFEGYTGEACSSQTVFF